MENSLLLPPVGVWAVLSPSLADHPLRPAIDRRLGELLPHQLANRTQAIPKALKALIKRPHAVLATLSGSYPSLWGIFLRVTQPSATRHHFSLQFQVEELGFGVIKLLPFFLFTASKQSEKHAAVRLACIRHAASVHPEPGSNSSKNSNHK